MCLSVCLPVCVPAGFKLQIFWLTLLHPYTPCYVIPIKSGMIYQDKNSGWMLQRLYLKTTACSSNASRNMNFLGNDFQVILVLQISFDKTDRNTPSRPVFIVLIANCSQGQLHHKVQRTFTALSCLFFISSSLLSLSILFSMEWSKGDECMDKQVLSRFQEQPLHLKMQFIFNGIEIKHACGWVAIGSGRSFSHSS